MAFVFFAKASAPTFSAFAFTSSHALVLLSGVGLCRRRRAGEGVSLVDIVRAGHTYDCRGDGEAVK